MPHEAMKQPEARREDAKRPSTAPCYNAHRLESLTEWLEQNADQFDQSAEEWAEGCPEALSDREDAIRFRLAAECVRQVAQAL